MLKQNEHVSALSFRNSHLRKIRAIHFNSSYSPKMVSQQYVYSLNRL